jgi:glycosyltransferase involved in cell wall biosynthesis
MREPVPGEEGETMKLSVIIPVYNEQEHLAAVLRRALSVPLKKEMIVIDDGSVDGSREVLLHLIGAQGHGDGMMAEGPMSGETLLASDIRAIFHERNRGKGAALRSGFAAATGDVLVIHDADGEYDPEDWLAMFRLIAEGKADVVYGSRFRDTPYRGPYRYRYLGNRAVSMLVSALCAVELTDVETCTKMFRREVVENLVLTCDDFGFELEFTIKIARARRWRIQETGIRYVGRSYAKGKKIGWRDDLRALWYIFKFCFAT